MSCFAVVISSVDESLSLSNGAIEECKEGDRVSWSCAVLENRTAERTPIPVSTVEGVTGEFRLWPSCAVLASRVGGSLS